MSRFFVPKESVKGNRILISGEEAHHILDVMRLKPLDKVVAFDGTGKEYVGFIKKARKKTLSVEIVETRTPLNKETAKIVLIQAIPKKDKMDYIVEKSTELGVSSIIPIITKRTIVSWDEPKKALSVERWRRIARESSKQCGRSEVPKIEDVKDFNDAIENSSVYDLALIAALSDNSIRLKEAISGFRGGKLAIAIGPEGDFTPDEIKKAKEANFRLISLGSRVLRSDTAGLAILAILNYEFAS